MDYPTPYAPSYRHVAWAYDALASAYSLGAIDRTKDKHLGLIKPGDRVLYVGAGRGKEIVRACQLGAEVTCVEPCPAMALRLHDRLAEHCEGFTIVPRAIQSISTDPAYDLVVANFFLNIFDAATMPDVLAGVCGFVKPGGTLVIGDFKPSTSKDGVITRAMRQLYYRPVNLAGWILRICALHPIYDYGPFVTDAGLTVTSQDSEGVLPRLPDFYESITARRL